MPESRHRRRRGRPVTGNRRGSNSLVAPRPRPRRRNRNWFFLIGSGAIAVLVIGSFLITGLLGVLGGGRTGTATGFVDGVGVQQEIMPTRDHVPETQTVDYNTIPATSGNHWERWAQCGFYEEELPDERVVHNLEHSNIVVSYNLSTPEEVAKLRNIFNDIGLANVSGVARAYSKIDPGTVALAAWGVSDIMQGVDKGRIEKFFEAYAGRLGPEGNIPCLNSGVMP